MSETTVPPPAGPPITDPEALASALSGPWLTKAEAADRMRVTERTLDRWAEAGRLTRYRVEGIQSVRFARAELDALIVAEPAAGPETN